MSFVNVKPSAGSLEIEKNNNFVRKNSNFFHLAFVPYVCVVLARLNIYFFLVYGRSMENELIGDTSGNFKRLLVSLVQVDRFYFLVPILQYNIDLYYRFSISQARRSENYIIDEAAAIRDAQALMSAGQYLRIWKAEF